MMFTHNRSTLKGLIAALVGLACLPLSTPSFAVVTETLKLLPSDGVAGDDFGASVAVNGSGLALVGAQKHGPGGAAYVFDALTGTELFKLVPDDQTAGSYFGSAMAVQNNLAYIGAPGQASTGAVYVYDMTTGLQVDKLTADDATTAPGGFGSSVAISGNGAVIGAYASRAAYLFDLNTSSQTAKITDSQTNYFGQAVDIDGDTAVVSAHSSAFLFDAVTGAPLGELPNNSLSAFGRAVAVDGNQALIGSPDNTYASFGSAHLYDISDLNNIHQTFETYEGNQGADGFFIGSTVELQGNTLLIGTWFASDGGPAASGAVYQFDPVTGDLLETFRSSDPAYDDLFGVSMDLAGDALIAGARGFEDTDFGSAYLFTIPEPASGLGFTGMSLALCVRGRHSRRQPAS